MVMTTCHSDSWFKQDPTLPTPKSTTQESMEMGRKLQSKVRIILRRQLNFQSYPMDEAPFEKSEMQYTPHDHVQTSYKREYSYRKPLLCKPLKPNEADTTVDPLFNRKTINDFDIFPWAPTKFMDDHMVSLSTARKKINFLRQLRYKSLSMP